MRFMSGFLELIILLSAALLIKWGAISTQAFKSVTAEHRRMTIVGFVLLIAWIFLAGIPNFLKSLKDNSELIRFRKNGFLGDQEVEADKRKSKRKKQKFVKVK